jgi:hypothetical protein
LRYIETMKRLGKIAICVAGGLLLNTGLRAAGPAPVPVPASVPASAPADNSLLDNPYATIATRNIFGLLPPPPPEDPAAAAAKDLPKITLTGIMSIAGQLQALFKVAASGARPARPGKSPANEEYYTLSEGQRQDDIEVVKIDEKNGLVTFINHGFTQELPLTDAVASGGGPAAPSSRGGMNPGGLSRPERGGPNGAGGFPRFSPGPGGRNGGANSVPGNSAPGNSALGNDAGEKGVTGGMDSNNPMQSHIYQPPAPQMSPEDTQTLITLQHLKAISENNPTAPLFPHTPFDKEAGITP